MEIRGEERDKKKAAGSNSEKEDEDAEEGNKQEAFLKERYKKLQIEVLDKF